MTTFDPRRSSLDRTGWSLPAEWVLGSTAASCAIIIAITLKLWGADEIRGELGEVFFLTFWGLVWIKIAFTFFPWLGISTRDDALEGRNPAGLITLAGAMLSLAFIYAGGSAGEGSSYSNNIFSAALGTLGFFALWLMLELGAHVSVSITVERDLGSGWRLGGFLFAIGLIFGRAEAGNWHSELATFHDFIEDGWPVLPLLTLALFGEWFLRPSRKQPFPSWARCGLCPALAYLLLAILWVWHLGRWEGMPR